MKVITVENFKAKLEEIDGSLESMQKLVDGYIEITNFGKYILICDEEGKLKGKQTSIYIPFDYVAGKCFIAKAVGEEIVGLDFKEQVEIFGLLPGMRVEIEI